MLWLAEKIDQMLKLFLKNRRPDGRRVPPHRVLASGCRALCCDSAAAAAIFSSVRLISLRISQITDFLFII